MSTPRTCPTCGAQVTDNERFCANCGSRLPEATAPGDQPPAASPTVVLRPEVEPTQALPAIPPTPAAQPSPPYGTPASPPQGSPPYGTPVSPSYGSPASPPQGSPAFNVPPAASAAPVKRGMPLWLIILLSVVGLCAVSCVAGFILLRVVGQNAISQLEQVSTELALTVEAGGLELPTEVGGAGGLIATSEPAEVPTTAPATTLGNTPEAVPTTAGAGGIVGGVAGASADPIQTAAAQTAEAQAAVGQAAAAATAEIEQIFAQASVAFSDEFVDNRNNWFTGVWEEIEEDRIEGGVFKVIWSGKGFSYELYQVREMTNFIAEVDCLVYQGGADGSCGLIFGQREDVGFYEYELFEDYYRLTLFPAEGDATLLAEGDPAGIVKPGETNRLRVIKRGDEIRIYVNGIELDRANDNSLPTGKVGVSTNSYLEEGGVEVWFDNFVIWQLP